MKVAVLGAGSWGTTVATLACGRNKTLLWARDPEVAREVNEDHANSSYLGHGPGCMALLACREPIIAPVVREGSNLADYLGIGAATRS